MDTGATVAGSAPKAKPRWHRFAAAQGLSDFERAKKHGVGQREFAGGSGIPRTTLQGWAYRKSRLAARPGWVAFFESPDGQEFLHHLHAAAHLTIGQESAGGIRTIMRLFDRAGLSPFIGLSFGAQLAAAKAMEANLLAYEAEQRQQLAKMPHIDITLVEDETFFKKIICLVAMEPVSGFIFVEEYATARDSPTWTAAVKASLQGLPITVIQGVSDSAKALRKHIEDDMGAHHAPDLFHGQRDIYKGVGPKLQALQRQAEAAYEEAKAVANAQVVEKETYLANVAERGPGRPPNFDVRVEMASSAENEALERLKGLADVKKRLDAAVNDFGNAYHPVNLASGKVQTVDEMEQRLEQSFDEIAEIADDLDVSERGQDLLAKAKRLIEPMLNTFAFFSESAIDILSNANLPPDLILFLVNYLIPLAYLKIAELKANGERRELIRSTIARLTTATQTTGSPWVGMAEEVRVRLLHLAEQCAERFQRSSSCVEGRNGLLSLYYHAGRRLPPERLRILRILHNFDIKRADETTAMERLSGIKPPDIFTWLLDRQPPPPRPRASRMAPPESTAA